VARYTYAPAYIDAVAVQERDLNADNDFADDDEVVYYHSSTLYSVYALSDASESVIERYRYDAYGACTVLDADGSVDGDGLSDVDNPYLFTARRLDAESGLMQYRFRDYSPELGRFPQRDPVGYAEAMCLYEFVNGTPTFAVDPMGLGFFGDLARGFWRMEEGVALWLTDPGEAARSLGRGIGVVGRDASRGAEILDRKLATLADPIFAGRLPGRASDEDVAAGYNAFMGHFGGLDTGAEFMFFGGGGVTVMSCCDGNNCMHLVTLKKICIGPMVSGGVTAHVLGSIKGKNCPWGYSGWFWEWGVAVVHGMHGKDVQGGGIQAAIGLGVARCYYWILTHRELGPC